jgi:hypothetical protein
VASFEQRAYESIRGRHIAKVRELAESIGSNAGYILADLDRGRIPRARSLPDDVRELDRRVNILEGLEELKGIYDSGERV